MDYKEKNPKHITYMTNTQNGKNAFYRVLVFQSVNNQFELVGHWGAIGNKGRYQLKNTFPDEISALNAAQMLVNNKVKKGYFLNEKETFKNIDTPLTEKVQEYKKKRLSRFNNILE